MFCCKTMAAPVLLSLTFLMPGASAHGAVTTTAFLPAGASATVLYDVLQGPDVRFDFPATDQDREETHDTDVLFGWDYGSVKMSNGATLMWCTGVSVDPPDGTKIPLYGLLSTDGTDLLVLGDIVSTPRLEPLAKLEVHEGIVLSAPALRVKDASLVDDVSLLLDHTFVGSLPDYSGTALYHPIGTRTFAATVPDDIKGDINGDGIADGRDLLEWQHGETPKPYSAAALAAWSTGFGGAVAPPVAAAAVPEPCGWMLGVLAASASLARRRLGAVVGRACRWGDRGQGRHPW
jgi:hypothetical protein